jgi:D-xylose transport system substrate-binding protein
MKLKTLATNRRDFMKIGGGAVAAASLGGPALAMGKTGRIGFAMSTFSVPRFKHLDLPFFEEAVRAAGMETVAVQANFDVNQQLNDVDNLLAQGIDALAIIAVNAGAGKNMVRKALRDGVPVIAYNNAIPSSDLSAFVSRDNRGVGASAARGADAAVGLEGNWVIASGQAGDSVADEMTAGYYDVLQPLIDAGKVNVVSHEFHDGWDPESARKQAENALSANNDNIRGFLCNDDGTAGGCIAALEQAGLAGKAFVSGQDATTVACRLIAEGKMTFSTFTRFDVMGRTAGELCAKLAKGEAINPPMTYSSGDVTVPLQPIEAFHVSRDNLVEYLDQYSPAYVDAESIFKDLPIGTLPPGAEKFLK